MTGKAMRIDAAVRGPVAGLAGTAAMALAEELEQAPPTRTPSGWDAQTKAAAGRKGRGKA